MCRLGALYILWVAVLGIVGWVRLKFVIGIFTEGLPPRARRWLHDRLPQWIRPTADERRAFTGQAGGRDHAPRR